MRVFKHISIWGGFIFPAIIGGYGSYCVLSRSALLPAGPGAGISGWYHVQGSDAIAIGVGLLGLACALHCRYFWARIKAIWPAGVTAQWIGLAVMAAGFVYAYWRLAMIW